MRETLKNAFLNKNIPLSISCTCFKFQVVILHGILEGTVSQFFLFRSNFLVLCHLENNALTINKKLPIF